MPYDPVTQDIIWKRLISLVDEAEAGLMRTSFVPRIRESGDFCCVLLDTKGDSVAQGSHSQVSFATITSHAAQEILKKFPAETLQPGDILITNNPWVQSGHLYDNFVLEPIFHKGELLALGGCVAHWSDIGGRGQSPDNRSLYEEGLQLPIMKIAKKGQFNEEVLEIIRENVRFPDDVMGEFKAQLVGINLIRTKLISLIERQGIEDFGELAETILGRSEAAMRNAIALIPDGDYENAVPLESIDHELTVKVKVSVRGTDLHVDFAGTSPQCEWCINSPPQFTYAYTFVGIKMMVAPYLPNNSGQMRPVSMSLPLGSIVNPRPRSVGVANRHIAAHHGCFGVLGALSRAMPERAQGESSPGGGISGAGVSDSGKPFLCNSGGTAGLGAQRYGDGISCAGFPHSTRNIPVEMFEKRYPMLLMERKGIRPDSGGPGRYRGGCGAQVDFTIVGQASAQFYNGVRRNEHPAQGSCGGCPGAAGSLLLNGLPVPGLRTISVRHGDRLGLRLAGGGGFGDPLERDPSLVLEDVLDGLVSLEQAEASYGVVIDADTKRLDLAATALLRRSRRMEAVDISGIPTS